MDLRNRDNYSAVIESLKSVKSPRYSQFGEMISHLAAEEAKLDQEIFSLTNAITTKQVKDQQNHNVSNLGTIRLHVFDMVHGKDVTLRINTSEGHSFSKFIDRVDFKLPSGEIVSWNRSDEVCDGITISRGFQNGGKAEIVVHVSYKDCLYSVPGKLEGGSVHHMTFVQLFKQICAYIKNHNLSSNDDPSYFTPDPFLHDLLYPTHPKDHPVSFASLLEAIRTHFKTPGPFHITHQIGTPEQVFDLLVNFPIESDHTLSQAVLAAENKLSSKLEQIDKEIGVLTNNIGQLGDEVSFLDKLCHNPVEYLKEVIETPSGTVKGTESVGLIDYMQLATSHEFYRQPWAVAAAAHLVGEQKKEKPSS